jgi:hypothetical protein
MDPMRLTTTQNVQTVYRSDVCCCNWPPAESKTMRSLSDSSASSNLTSWPHGWLGDRWGVRALLKGRRRIKRQLRRIVSSGAILAGAADHRRTDQPPPRSAFIGPRQVPADRPSGSRWLTRDDRNEFPVDAARVQCSLTHRLTAASGGIALATDCLRPCVVSISSL